MFPLALFLFPPKTVISQGVLLLVLFPQVMFPNFTYYYWCWCTHMPWNCNSKLCPLADWCSHQPSCGWLLFHNTHVLIRGLFWASSDLKLHRCHPAISEEFARLQNLRLCIKKRMAFQVKRSTSVIWSYNRMWYGITCDITCLCWWSWMQSLLLDACIHNRELSLCKFNPSFYLFPNHSVNGKCAYSKVTLWCRFGEDKQKWRKIE